MKLPCRAEFVVAGAIIVLTGWSTTGLTDQYLSATELPKALIGRTIASTTKRGFPYTITFSNATSAIYVMKGDTSDLAVNFTGDAVCFQSKKYNFQECNKVKVNGVKYDFMDLKTGNLNNTYDVE